MKKIKICKTTLTILLFILCPYLFSSCEGFLNVNPSNEIAASEQFSSEVGFQEALSGAYTLMTVPELYGREMTFGFMDVVAQQYGIFSDMSSPYFYAQYFEYNKGGSISLCDNVWCKQFTVLANVNDILAFVDENRNVFSTQESYKLVKGEALAMRAFLHFDLLRLYVPYDADRTSTLKVMPYVEEFTKNTSVSLTFKEVADKIIGDLTNAADLMRNDPIVTGEASSDTYFKNRIYHLNYYAVKALLARVNLYIGEKNEAAKCASEVIEAQKNKGLFQFVKSGDVSGQDRSRLDRTFSSEHVFTLNVIDLQDYTLGYTYQINETSKLLCRKPIEDIFEGYSEYRSSFFETESGVKNVPSKFWQVDKTKEFIHKMPMIRISEMYYILAECNEDIEHLNTVRTARNIPDMLTADHILQDEILKEYKKEFIGEGQLFYYYKRLMVPDIEFMPPNYILPMPKEEIDFGGRPRPEDMNKESN